MQGGEVIDKVMMIKDVHGPEAWVPKKIKYWTESRQYNQERPKKAIS